MKDKILHASQEWGKKIGLDLPYFVKNGFWMTVRQLVDLLTSLAPSIAFARLLDKNVFGEYQFFLATLATISVISLPGLNTALFRSVSRGFDGDYKKVVKTSFIWSLIGVPILICMGSFFYLTQRPSLGIALIISSLFFPFIYAPNTWNAFLQGKRLYPTLVKFSSTQAMVNTFFTIGIIFISPDKLLPIILAYLISFTFFNCWYFIKSMKLAENTEESKDVLSYGYFLTKMNVFQTLSDNIDRLVLGFLLPPIALANFSIISTIAIKLKNVIRSVLTIIFPKMSLNSFPLVNSWKKNKKAFYIFGALNIFLCLIFFFSIETINKWLFGERYQDFYSYSRIFAIFIFFSIPSTIVYWYIQAKKMKKIIFFTNPVYFLIKIIVTVIFIYKWGLLGVIWSYNINAIILFAMYLLMLKFSENESKLKIQED